MSAKNEKKIEQPNGKVLESAPNALSPRRVRVKMYFSEPTLTEQSHKDECDINQVVAKYSGDELRELMDKRPALYGDFTSAPGYKEALDIVQHAKEQFDALPSKVRAEFNNNPADFLKFAEKPENKNRLLELGLAEKRAKIDPPASRADIEKLGEKLSPKGKSQPAGGHKGESDPS